MVPLREAAAGNYLQDSFVGKHLCFETGIDKGNVCRNNPCIEGTIGGTTGRSSSGTRRPGGQAAGAEGASHSRLSSDAEGGSEADQGAGN